MAQKMESSAEVVNQLFDCLSHPRRRSVITVVAAESTPSHIDDLVDGIAAAETAASLVPARVDERGEVATTLVHAHLPKLRSAGIIDASSDPTTITEEHRFDLVTDHLDLV